MRWIPCSERMPAYWQDVLTWDGRRIRLLEYRGTTRNEARPAGFYEEDDYGPVRITGVSSWMPLPDPPGHITPDTNPGAIP